jgi:hypothetical protein
MVELLLPRTDGGALAQALGAVVVFGGVAFAVRRNREMLVFVAGLATVTAAWFALRTVH